MTGNKIYFILINTECVEGTNTVCTPFTHNGELKTDCVSGWWDYWCLIDDQTGDGSDYSVCGDCLGQPIYPTTTASVLSKVFTVKFKNILFCTLNM